MIKRLLFPTVILCLIITGCTSTEETETPVDSNIEGDNVPDSIVQPESIIDTTQVVTENGIGAIEEGDARYLKASIIQKLDQLHAEMQEIKTKEALDLFYSKSLKFREEHMDSIYAYESNFLKQYFAENPYSSHGDLSSVYYEYNDRFSPMYIECGGECIDMLIILNNASFSAASKQTPSEIDDAFFELVRLLYGDQSSGEYVNRFKWIEYWSDEDHSCNIGNNEVFTRIENIVKFNQAYPTEYVSQTSEMMKSMEGAIFGEEKFMLKKEQVLTEFSNIQMIEGLPESLKQKVAEEIARVDGLEDDAFTADPY